MMVCLTSSVLFSAYDGNDHNSTVAGVTAAKIDSNTPHIRRKHRRAKSGSKIEANGDGNGGCSVRKY